MNRPPTSLDASGVLINMRRDNDPQEFVKHTLPLEADCPEDGRMSHQLPDEVYDVKRVLLNGNRCKFKFERKTRTLRILDLVSHKGDTISMLAVVRRPVTGAPRGNTQAQ